MCFEKQSSTNYPQCFCEDRSPMTSVRGFHTQTKHQPPFAFRFFSCQTWFPSSKLSWRIQGAAEGMKEAFVWTHLLHQKVRNCESLMSWGATLTLVPSEWVWSHSALTESDSELLIHYQKKDHVTLHVTVWEHLGAAISRWFLLLWWTHNLHSFWLLHETPPEYRSRQKI